MTTNKLQDLADVLPDKKPRKPRESKPLSPADIVIQFGRQKLVDKLSIKKLIDEDIAEEEKTLQQQLSLITSNK